LNHQGEISTIKSNKKYKSLIS